MTNEERISVVETRVDMLHKDFKKHMQQGETIIDKLTCLDKKISGFKYFAYGFSFAISIGWALFVYLMR